jgi:CRP/FNR family cyclic AMP-dependent transcriptional regulator
MLLQEDLGLNKALARNFVFRGLPDSLLATVAGLALKRHYVPEEVIVKRFGKGTDLIIILEGTACIHASSGDIIAEFGPGSIIGEISLVDEQPRSATVMATSPVTAAVIPIDALRGAISMDPAVGLAIMRNIAAVLCLRLRHMDDYVDAIGSTKRFDD